MPDQLVMAVRGHDGDAEAEPLVVRPQDDGTVILELDDGEELRVDREELLSAVESA